MHTEFPSRTAGWPRPLPWLLGLAVLGLALGSGRAQEKISLGFSEDPEDKNPPPNALLRPNKQQELFVFVKNDDKEREVVVEMLLNGAPMLTSAKTRVAGDGKLTRISLAPKGNMPPPPLAEVKGRVSFRILDDKGKAIGEEADVRLQRPADFIKVDTANFKTQGKDSNKFEIKFSTIEPFADKATLSLDLSPELEKALAPNLKRKGFATGFLSGKKGSTLELYLEDLIFRKAEDEAKGEIWVEVDGYPRAFVILATLDKGSTTPRAATELLTRSVRLRVDPYAKPGAPIKVGVEIAAMPATSYVKLEVKGKSQSDKAWNEVGIIRTERQQKVLFSPVGPGGGLLFKAEHKDWVIELNLEKVNDDAEIRATMVHEMGQPTVSTAIVSIDGNKPRGLAFTAPKKGDRYRPGDALEVQAFSLDPAEDFARVEFFLGKPTKEGKPPETARLVEATITKAKDAGSLSTATLRVPPEQKGPLEVSVQFVKKSGVSSILTTTVEQDDATAEDAQGKPKPGSISGRIVEGSVPQPDLDVMLLDAKDNNAVKGSEKTDKEGKFTFKDVPPGSYTVLAKKSASRTEAKKAVALQPGEKKDIGDVKLLRP